MDIIKCFSTTNTTYKKSRQIKYIVLHYTAGTHSEKGQARAVASMFARAAVGGSADFIVDDAETVQYNGDIRNRYCWSVGGSKYTSMSTSEGGKLYNICTNSNSISIEMCSSKKDRSNTNGDAPDWYLTAAVVKNALELTKYLMDFYGVPLDRVIMHHHVTGKLCPQPWTLNESRLSGWYDFKKKLMTGGDDEMTETINIRVNGKDIEADAINKDGSTFIKLRALEAAGFKVGYDADTKLRKLDNAPNELTLFVNNEIKDVKAVLIDGRNFVALRDMAAACGYDVDYVEETRSVILSDSDA